jgi:hypothetical protein
VRRKSVAGASASLANAIGVNGRATTASCGTNSSALSATRDAANERTGANTASRRQLISMFRPETSAVLMSVSHTGGVRVPGITVSVSQLAARPCGNGRRQQRHKTHYDQQRKYSSH